MLNYAVNCEGENNKKSQDNNDDLLNLNFDSVSQSNPQHEFFSKHKLKATWRRVTMALPLSSRSLIAACFAVLILWNIALTVRVLALNSKQTLTNSVLLSSDEEKIQVLEKKIETLEEFIEHKANQIKIGSGSTGNLRLEGGTIWFQESKEVQLTEEPTSTSRQWSESSLKILVGTAVKWTWMSNENVVEATESYSIPSHPRFKSGNLQDGGSFTYTFEEPGTYYFVSENTAAMRGSVTVEGFYTNSGDLHIPGDLYLGGEIYN